MPTFFPIHNQPLQLSIWIGNIAGEYEWTAQINGYLYKSTKQLRMMVEATPGFEELSPEERGVLILKKWMSPIYNYLTDIRKKQD